MRVRATLPQGWRSSPVAICGGPVANYVTILSTYNRTYHNQETWFGLVGFMTYEEPGVGSQVWPGSHKWFGRNVKKRSEDVSVNETEE